MAATHRGELLERYAAAQRHLRYVGVEGADVQEAAVACAACQPRHVDALSGPCYPLIPMWPTLPSLRVAQDSSPYRDAGEGPET